MSTPQMQMQMSKQIVVLKSFTNFYNPNLGRKKKVPVNKSLLHFKEVPHKWNSYMWENAYANLHLSYKSVRIREMCTHLLKKRKLDANLFLFHKRHGELELSTKAIGFYTPKLSKLFKSIRSLRRKQNKIKVKQGAFKFQKGSLLGFPLQTSLTKNKIFRRLLKKTKTTNKKDVLKNKAAKELLNYRIKNKTLYNLGTSMRAYSFSPSLFLKFWNEPLPKTYILENAQSAFSRFKNNIHFWSGLQTLKLVVLGRGSAQLLAHYVINGVRRNRKRVAFIIYLKRLIDWHFHAVEDLKIQGIRIETKGRFNAKSRCRKYILYVGRVAKGEKTSQVDYAFTKAITVFGSLGIKVWICPL